MVLLLTAPIISTPAQSPRDRTERDLERRMQDMRALDQVARRRPPRSLRQPELTRAQKEYVQTARRIETDVVQQYAALLVQPRTGVFKLFPDLRCFEDKVVRLDDECTKAVPLSSAFNFREGAYGDVDYHDIWFDRGRLVSAGFFSQGIIASLGDVPLESVGVETPAVTTLVSVRPETTASAAAAAARRFRDGVDAGGILLADSVEPQAGRTYAIRLIAYRLSNSLPPVDRQTSETELMLHSLAFDKRLDIVVAFRVVRRDSETGGLTIVWRELARHDADKLRFGKGELMADFKPPRPLE
ncbi:MAG: hypothetical protein ACK4S4_08950 [Pyrinomonadaceae bacterium]